MQRRRKLYKTKDKLTCNLHSIPILFMLKNKVKSNVLYSIPGVAVLVFLFGLFSIICNLAINTDTCSAIASTSLTIDGGNSKTITETIIPNETKYVSSNITYSAIDATDYTININYAEGSTGLKLEGGSTTIPDVTNTSDSSSEGDSTNNGVLGSSISNAWGYTWTPTTTPESDYGNLYYKGISAYNNTTNSTVETGTAISTTTKKLIFAANLSDTNPTGHYKAQIVLSLVATPKATTYTLTLDNNATSGITNAGTTSKECSTYTDSCTISLDDVTTPTRTNYEFLGWAGSNSATSATYTTSSTITMTGDKTVWAVWEEKLGVWTLPDGSKVDSGITYMQDITTGTSASGFCSSNIPNGSTIRLKDNRVYPVASVRNNTNTESTTQQISDEYIIAKYPDGKCWMVQNLRLTGSDNATTLITGSVTGNSNTSGNYNIPKNDPSAFVGNNTGQATFLGTDNAGNITGYYTWCTATAGSCFNATSKGRNASYSICPKGWRLPMGGLNKTGTNVNEFYDLIVTTLNPRLSTASLSDDWFYDKTKASINIQANPYAFVFTGSVSSGAYTPPSMDITGGYWWSSTAYSDDYAYYLAVSKYSENISPGTRSNARYNGWAVRCVAE